MNEIQSSETVLLNGHVPLGLDFFIEGVVSKEIPRSQSQHGSLLQCKVVCLFGTRGRSEGLVVDRSFGRTRDSVVCMNTRTLICDIA